MDDTLTSAVREHLHLVTLEECKEFIAAFYRTYDRVLEYQDAMRALVHKQGWVVTMFGRIRHIPEIRSSDKHVREYAERSAINLPVQGSSADLMKLAIPCVAWSLRLLKLRVPLVLTIHDSLVARAQAAQRGAVAWVLRYAMERTATLPLATPVDLKSGPNMLALEEMKDGAVPEPGHFTEREGVRALRALLPLWRDQHRARNVHPAA